MDVRFYDYYRAFWLSLLKIILRACINRHVINTGHLIRSAVQADVQDEMYRVFPIQGSGPSHEGIGRECFYLFSSPVVNPVNDFWVHWIRLV